jgi:hypothetical protein
MGVKEGNLFPRVWSIGSLDILGRQMLGLLYSVKCPGDLILRTYDLARALRDAGFPVISGFHTLIEKDCLDLLLCGGQSVVLCPARSIHNMRLAKDLKANIEKGVFPVGPEKFAQWAVSLANGSARKGATP